MGYLRFWFVLLVLIGTGVSCRTILPAPATLASPTPRAAPKTEQPTGSEPTFPATGDTLVAPTKILPLETPLLEQTVTPSGVSPLPEQSVVPSEVPPLPEQTAAPANATPHLITTPVTPKIPVKGARVSMTGWFVIVYNEQPHYSITEPQGLKAELVIDDKLAQELGGMRQFDRKLVTIEGEVVNNDPLTVQVTQIRLAQ